MYVYLLECKDRTIYTGMTGNLKRRILQHKKGYGANYTKKHGVERLMHTEHFETREEAANREKEIKTWTHLSKRALAAGTLVKPIIFRKFRYN